MCFGSPSYPEPPDPAKTAQAQGAINKETAQYQTQLNMVDQSGPFGSLTYRPTGDQIQTTKFDQDAYDKDLNHWRVKGLGGTSGELWGKPDANSEKYVTTINEGPRYEAVTTLSPEQQQLADQQFGLQTSMLDVGQNQLNRVDSALSSPMSMKNLPSLQVQVPGIQSAGSIARAGSAPQLATSFDQGGTASGVANMQQLQRAPGSVPIGVHFDRGGAVSDVGADDYGDDRQRVEDALMARMQPYMDQRREQERTRLVNQGFSDPNSEAYSNEMDEVYRAENDARMAAILNAGQEQERLFGMELAGTGFNNQAQAQRFGQNMTAQDFENQARLLKNQNIRDNRGFNNNAALAEQNAALATQSLNNQAQQQRFGQNAALAGFGNDAQLQQQQAELAAAGFNNAAQSQQFGQNVAQQQAATARAEHINRARQQAIQERAMQRQMPINEIAALMSGSQVSMPQFVNTPQTGVQAPDFQGATYASYQGQLANAQREAQQQNALTQGLFSLGGAGLGAFGATNGFGWFG